MTPRHHNSFDFLRLVFALLVIITHSLVLGGAGEADFLYRATGGHINCSYLGVRGFFVISGFLIFKSLQRSDSPLDYLKKRFLRLFPALVVMLLVVAFVAGPVFSDLSPHDYFHGDGAWRYVGSALRLPGVRKTASLPGLFTGNPATDAVNGSLWTIWFELLFYLGLLPLFFLRSSPRVLQWLLPALWAVLFLLLLTAHGFLDRHIFPFTGMSAEVAVDLGLYFLAGAALTRIRWERPAPRLGLLLTGLLLAAAGLWLHQFHYLRYPALSLAVIALGHFHVPLFDQIRRLGEPSYGIYIYAYPVQQLVIQELTPIPWMITIIALPVALLLGYASWHFVEAPCLALKRKFKSRK